MKIKNGFRITWGASRSLPVEYFVLANVQFEGRVIGHLAGRPIRETAVDGDGLRYRFVGIAPRDERGRFDVQSLQTGEWIVEPGLVYAQDLKLAADRGANRAA
ncbi:hypothetical protein [Sinorhizobium mexicanum]|uniref:Uncharacterized protein n=1 Tax=Sinorhizobium mexicanum TaxID=375549 RepID=A0A859QZ46_9HYPH|nr:hypothetical protein [Sinorhizobium mexicanum]MBP1884006.1 hypothetical protein [Sinorhizobium mexicanum]QLL64729.1 hypothetical protein FKV68_25330 [Sinorhizobium mexicanum]